MLAHRSNNSMAKKKFDQEVNRFKTSVDVSNREHKIRKFLLENNPGLALRFKEALKLMDQSSNDTWTAILIGKLKRYQSSEFGYSFREAVAATMWWSISTEYGVKDKSKVEEAIKMMIDYRPEIADKVIAESIEKTANVEDKRIKFKNDHRISFVVGYILWCLVIFIGSQFWTTVFTHDVFLRYFVPIVVTGFYILTTYDVLKKKKH